MKRQIENTIAILLTVCFVLSITTVAVSASVGDSNAGVVSKEIKSNGAPNSYVVQVGQPYLGKTYGDWSAEWWKWVLSIPKYENPILDKTGENGGIGQSGDVWFLAGTYGKTGVERTIEIPAGKAIFVPMINVVSFPYPDPEDDVNLTNDVTYYIDHFVTAHQVELDGKNLDNFRVISNIFIFTVPRPNYLNLFYPTLPAGSYRAASGGYWIMLKPLPEGVHKIRIYGKAEFPDGSKVETGVTYMITIKP